MAVLEREREGGITGGNAFDVPDWRTARAPVVFEFHSICFLLCFLEERKRRAISRHFVVVRACVSQVIFFLTCVFPPCLLIFCRRCVFSILFVEG